MRTIGFILFTILFLPTFALAQAPAPAPEQTAPSRVNVFAGYSFYSTALSSQGRASTYGWEGSGEVRLYRWVSIVGDIDTHYGQQGFPICQTFPTTGLGCSTFTADIIERNFLVGPRASFTTGAFRPFAEVLVGGAHVNAGVFAGTDNSWAAAIGGGADYTITPRFGWRLQADYVRTQFFGNTQNNVRASTGLVFRF
jgi:Outer membrane protein beta-barrel domain